MEDPNSKKECDPLEESKKQSWWPKKSIKSETEPKDFSTISDRIDIIIMTVNEYEFKAVFELLQPLEKQSKIWRGIKGNLGYYIGKFGLYNVALVKIDIAGMASALPSMLEACKTWKPQLLANIGIAFGMKKGEQKFGDTLVAMRIVDNDMKKVKIGETIHTSAIPEMSPKIKSTISMARDVWEFKDLKGQLCKAHMGLIVSSDTLVNNHDLKSNIMKEWPQAIGGEMEAYALYTAGHWENIPWIFVKGISDWGDGTKQPDDPYHPLASASAASLFYEFCSIPDILKKIRDIHIQIEINQTFAPYSVANNKGTVNYHKN